MNKSVLPIVMLCAAALASFTARARQNVNTLKNTIVDNSIVLPESFETDTKALMNNWYLKNYTVLDSYVENSKTEEVSDELYIKRLSALPTEIEMPYNQIVRTYIEMYTERRRTLVEEMLGLSLYYMPIFEQALEKEGLPLELKYLPVIESALNPDAVSRVGATGLWQFMISAAKGFGLEVNSLVDERRDPYRSSEKAAAFLKNLYNIYHDWSLVIAAYNCGPGNVNKALRRAGGTGKDFWAIYPYLPKETRGYVPAFIAANYVMTYFKNHDISPSLAMKPLLTDTVMVNERIHFNQISKVLNMPIDELRVLNPQYRRDVIPGNTHSYSLCLPVNQVYSFIMSKDSILNYRTDLYGKREVVEPATINDNNDDQITGVEGVDFTYENQTVTKYHKVARNETLASIARKYGVTTSSIKRANGLKKSSVKRGQSLKIVTTQRVKVPIEKPEETATDELLTQNVTDEQNITTEMQEAAPQTEQPAETPVSEPAPVAKPEQKSNSASSDGITTKHTVRSGETLAKIASDNGITISQLKEANNLSSEVIKAGQVLTIPSSNATTKPAKQQQPATSRYAVRKGDNLAKIAKSHNVTLEQLRQANNMSETDNDIRVGQVLNIPVAGTQSSSSAKANDTAKRAKATKTHTVKSGETLGAIAEKYGTTVSAIKRASGIKSDRLSIGQKLKIPQK
ncbi:MAG: LysM peptidoglycan-binding domain-containing protein [Muribaculaceae bacterium]